MTDDATEDQGAGQDEAADAVKHPAELPRRKMNLFSQAAFMRQLQDRCRMHSPDMRGTWAGQATLTLTADDMAALVCIEQTLSLFDFYDAPAYVRAKAERRAAGKSGRSK